MAPEVLLERLYRPRILSDFRHRFQNQQAICFVTGLQILGWDGYTCDLLVFLGKMMASPKILLLITVACELLKILPIPALFQSPLGQLLWACWGYGRVTHWPPQGGCLPLWNIGYKLTPSILWPRILLGHVQEIPRNWAWIEDFTFIFLKCLKIWFCCLVWGLQRSM